MKTLKTLGKLGIVTVSLFFAACSSDGGGSGVGGGSGSFIKGKVDGSSFETLSIQGQSTVAAMRTGTGDQTIVTVSGSSSELKSMYISTIGITEPGTYEIGPDSASVLAFVDSNTQVSYDTSNCDQATGTLKITTLTDTKVEGTFNFVGKVDENCTQTKTITNGSFRGVFMNN